MGDKKKLKKTSLCDLKKLLEDDAETFFELVRDPKFICKKCGRAAKSEDNLCKPTDLEKS